MIDDAELTQYDELNEALRRVGSSADVAECHGLLSGLLCVKETVDSATWISHILGTDPDADTSESSSEEIELNEDGRALLSALLGRVLDQLNDMDYGFHPLLPDDDEPLEKRAAALAEWCQGFTLGLSMGGIEEVGELPEASAEIIKDMADIAQMHTDADAATNEDEAAYAEIVEYVRMGVLLVREELRAISKPHPDDVVVH